ncbi:flavodoxin family protein [Listeria monocytogenes]|uniref:NAD(P)H-dependent oxidoreductase n=1 Tax=Listeria monocytogenes TaxID=1639 RepID=UPI0011EA93D3|nr:NAD(P)H-dependent oxidoreductase [Listeria monocytogenes]EHD1589143.1 flavodoxin family protein [Listeria monocytogenes]TYV33127.1 flavodoxin family protein [Listeria monocytogenes]HAO6015900.1 flavodoxin family protein [Listeria monocytogenes]
MSLLIIYAHPYEKSFNQAILSRVSENLERQGASFELIDLYKEQFDPRYTAAELRLYATGASEDKKTAHYQELIMNCSEIIFICPLWWNDLPAILKGFIDKVMKKNFAYESTSTGVKGKLTHIKQAKIITTSISPTWYIRLFAGDAIKSVFLKATLKQIGIKHSKWINLGSIDKLTDQRRKVFLNSL